MPDSTHEGHNPTRRFKHFRPRQASMGYVSRGSSVNFATGSLYNNSTGAHYVALRDFQVQTTGANPIRLFFTQSNLISSSGTVGAIIPTEIPGPGLVGSSDQASQTAGIFKVNSNGTIGRFAPDFPIAILPPGWAINFQSEGGASDLRLSVLWEWLYSDELDYMY